MQYPTVDRVMDPMEMTARLAKMSNDQLRSYAQMHSDDPNVIALALAESKRRQAMKPQPQFQPQPTVLEQELGAMETDVGLPEDSGIAQLPAENIEGMAEGGIVAFARGGDAGSDPTAAYRQYARKRAAEAGLDPDLVDALFHHESRYNPNAVSPKKAVGIGQLMPKTAKAYGLTEEDMRDPYKNMDAAIKELVQLNRKYKGDPSKVLNAYNWGQGNLDDALKAADPKKREWRPAETRKHEASILAGLATLAPPAIAAAEPQAPAAPADDSAPWMKDVQGLWEKLTGTKEEKAAELERYRRNRAVTAAENEADKQYFLGTTPDYNLAKGRADQTRYPTRGSQAPYQAELAAQQAAQQAQGIPEPGPAATPIAPPRSGYDPEGMWDEQNAAAEAPEPQTTAPAEEKSFFDRLSGDDWMNLGLSLLKSRSPYWQESLGEAGETMMAGRRASEKAALEKQKAQSDADYKKALAEAYTQKDDTAFQRMALEAISRARAQADKAVEVELAKSPTLFEQSLKDPTTVEALRQRYFDRYMAEVRKDIQVITGKQLDFGTVSGGGAAAPSYRLEPGKGLVPIR